MLFPVLAAVGLAAVACAAPQKRDLAQVVYSCTVPNTAAITFDDGTYDYVYDIVRMLNEAGAVGTFFLNGNNYGCIYNEANQARVKHVYEQGHQLASHTWGHENLATLSWDQLHDEMWRVEEALRRIVGVVPAFMRPPFGSFNDLVREVAAARGQTIAIWDFDSGDSVGKSAEESKAEYNRVANERPSSVLTLNHETYASTAYEVLPHAIWALKNAGYRLVSLSECLGGMPAYQSVGAPETPNDSWTC